MGKFYSKLNKLFKKKVRCSKCKVKLPKNSSFKNKNKTKFYCATCVPNDLFRYHIYGEYASNCIVNNKAETNGTASLLTIYEDDDVI